MQKYLKESLSFKEISRRLEKNPTTISREVRKYSSEIATGYQKFPYDVCKNALTVEIRIFVAKNAPENQLSTVGFVLLVIQNVQRLLKKFALSDSEFLMFAMVAKPFVNVHF